MTKRRITLAATSLAVLAVMAPAVASAADATGHRGPTFPTVGGASRPAHRG